jgi:outer membrane lipoprotein-sorting protein
MKKKKAFIFFIALTLTLMLSGVGFTDHPQADVKGTVTKIEAVEYEITLKDDKGKETKVKVKDTGGVKIGDSVVVKDGMVKKAVKPISGGY